MDQLIAEVYWSGVMLGLAGGFVAGFLFTAISLAMMHEGGKT